MERLDWNHYDLLLSFFKTYSSEVADTQLTNVLIWSSVRSTYVLIEKKTLFFFLPSPKKPNSWIVFREPIGAYPLSSLLRDTNLSVEGIVRAPTSMLHECFHLGWSMKTDPSHAEYIYSTKIWSSFEGHALHRQRQFLHKFFREKNWSYSPLYLKEKREAEAFFFDIVKDPEQREVAQRLFQYLHIIPFEGALLRVDGEIVALLIGECISSTTLLAHLGKGKENGDFMVLLHLFAQHTCEKYTWINLEQDLGIPGLRTFKERLSPSHQIVKWSSYP